MERDRTHTLEALLSDALAPTPTPSPQTMAYVRGLARLLRPDRPAPKVAWLSSVGGLVAAGARGAAAGAQRVYETDQHVVTLWDEAEDAGRHYVIGQVYARSGGAMTPRAVALLLPDDTERAASCEGTEFHLTDVAPGTYLIRCTLDADELIIPGVAVGAAHTP